MKRSFAILRPRWEQHSPASASTDVVGSAFVSKNGNPAETQNLTSGVIACGYGHSIRDSEREDRVYDPKCSRLRGCCPLRGVISHFADETAESQISIATTS
jgi:hypothetical protein